MDSKARFPQGGRLDQLSYDFAAHRGTQKAGEVCEDFFQYVAVMNMATNVQSDFCSAFVDGHERLENAMPRTRVVQWYCLSPVQ